MTAQIIISYGEYLDLIENDRKYKEIQKDFKAAVYKEVLDYIKSIKKGVERTGIDPLVLMEKFAGLIYGPGKSHEQR